MYPNNILSRSLKFWFKIQNLSIFLAINISTGLVELWIDVCQQQLAPGNAFSTRTGKGNSVQLYILELKIFGWLTELIT